MTRDLNYTKSILKKVSFDPYLFKKELKKAYYLLGPQDKLDLENWVKDFIQNKQALRSVILSNSGIFTLG
tara:strand:+ start:131 stop:340 length:210 start_codon:yes stop_codon:yes gene_type:complete